MNTGKKVTPRLPPKAPKLHLNEHLSPDLARQLRKHGFDVTSSQEANLLSEPDDRQMEFAATEQRAIVTFNIRDFLVLHEQYLSAGLEHWGLLVSARQPLHIMFRRLPRLLRTVSAEDLKNQIRWLNDFD